jgi:uncharacterized membrane protein
LRDRFRGISRRPRGVYALEFQLGADIVATTVGPTANALIQLGLVALIRTFLNFFLGRELVEQAKLKNAITTPTTTGT